MPRPSRRALLELLGTGTAAMLAGCEAGAPTDAASGSGSPTASPSEPPTATSTGTDSGTEASTSTPIDRDCTALPRPEAAWPVPRRSPARDGYAPSQQAPETAPEVALEAEPSTHDTDAHPSYGQPVVASSDLYLTNHLDRGPERPMYGHVHALDAGSGDRRWASGRLRSPSSPVVWGDLVVVVAETESRETLVVAFDRADGTRRWTRQFAARDRGFARAGDHLYLALEEDSDRGTVRALADDGTTVWRREAALGDPVNEGPTVGTDAVYAATRRGRLHALDREDGGTRWIQQFEHPVEPMPFVSDLVVTDCGAIAVVEGDLKALDGEGTLVWETAGEHGQMATDGATVYLPAELPDGGRAVRTLSAATGEVRWTVQGAVQRFQPPVLTSDTVYVPFDDGIVALAREDGTERWRTDGSPGELALADGTLYGIDDDALVAFR